MNTRVFILGSHPALSAAEVAAAAARHHWKVSWDLSRLPRALFGEGHFPLPRELQPLLGGTTMLGALRATLQELPAPQQLLGVVPEIRTPRQGKRLIALSALPSPATGVSHDLHVSAPDLAVRIRRLALDLKRALGMKGTRVVFPAARRPDLSTAQLLHNRLPREGTVVFLLVARERVDLVTVDALQDIEGYARRDRGRPHADPGRGMLPPKVAQMLLNLSLVPPGGTVYDPFCGVGTIPMEALLMGLKVIASDISPKQVERTRENLHWLELQYLQKKAQTPGTRSSATMNDLSTGGMSAEGHVPHGSRTQIFAHDVTRGRIPLPDGSVDAIVTEGWLGPARTSSPLPREADAIVGQVCNLLEHLLSVGSAVLRAEGRVVVTVPAFRIRKRLLPFPLERVRAGGWMPESLVPADWRTHPLFRGAARGTLLYGRPDAIVLREIVRFCRM